MKNKLRFLLALILATSFLMSFSTQVFAEAPGDTVTLSVTINPGLTFDSFDVTFNYSDGLEFVMQSTGKTYKDHASTIMTWYLKDKSEGKLGRGYFIFLKLHSKTTY